jgi:outer membrane lipoprotein SlyB
MSRIALITASAIALAGCATTSPSPYGYGGGTMSAQRVNCGAGVVGGALLGGLAGNQVGKGKGQDVATIAGATVGGLLGATRDTCQQQQPYGQTAYDRNPQPVLAGYDAHGRPVYR